MRLGRRIVSILGILMLIFITSGCGWFDPLEEDFSLSKQDNDAAPEQLIVGMVPSETVMVLLESHASLLGHLESKLGVELQPRFASSYSEILNRMNQDEFDIVLLAPLAYVLHSRQQDIYNPVLRPIQFGKDHYRALIFAKAGGGIDSIQDIPQSRFAFVDRDSTSGYLFPIAELIDRGIELDDQFFRKAGFLGRHDRVVRAVYQGEYNAGATYDDARPDALPEGVDADQALPVLLRSRKIPTAPIVFSQRFRNNQPERAKQFIQIMLNLHNTPGGKQALERMGDTERYIRAEPSDYEPVRKVLNTLIDKTGDEIIPQDFRN